MTYIPPLELEIIRRPSPAPTVPVALGARSVCRGVFPEHAHEDRQIRPWVKLLWGVKGQGRVRLGRFTAALPPASIAIFFPGMRHEAWAEQAPWEVRWLTLDGTLCGQIARGLGFLKAGVYPAGAVPEELFLRLRTLLADPTPENERLADAAAYALLTKASLGAPRASSLVEEAKAMIQQNWASDRFGIETMAAELGVHRSRLSRVFHREVGVAPIRYLVDLRMHAALNLLKTTDMTVREIAYRCGYHDPSHFCRVFRASQGMTPGGYRVS